MPPECGRRKKSASRIPPPPPVVPEVASGCQAEGHLGVRGLVQPLMGIMDLIGSRFGNPRGIVAQSPGLMVSSTPAGLWPGHHPPPNWPQPCWGCRPRGTAARGSAAGATPGFEAESRWDSGGNCPGWHLIDLFEADACQVQDESPLVDETTRRRVQKHAPVRPRQQLRDKLTLIGPILTLPTGMPAGAPVCDRHMASDALPATNRVESPHVHSRLPVGATVPRRWRAVWFGRVRRKVRAKPPGKKKI
jgi:hypothetical protein